MTYERRRRVGSMAGALGAVLLTAVGTLALGGDLPHRIGKPDGRERAAGPRTVVERVEVRRAAARRAAARRAAAEGAAPSSLRAAAPVAAPRAAAPTRRGERRRAERRERRRPGRRKGSPAVPVPAGPGAAPLETGGYRGFAAATAAVMSGSAQSGLTLARAGSGAALDGRPPETADEIGPLVAELPADRTAFGRAIPWHAGGAIADAPGDGVATASSPSESSTAADEMHGMQGTSAARTDPRGRCVRGRPISAAAARAPASERRPDQSDPVLVSDTAHSRTETLLDPGNGARFALTTIAEVLPPDITLAGVTVRFLGPVVLTVRAGGTAGSASVELGPLGSDTAAPLVEVVGAGRSIRYTGADLLTGGGRHLKLGTATLTIGGAPHARGDAAAPPQVAEDGTSAAAAADLLSLRAGDARVTAGHVEAAAAVPPRGIGC